MSLRLWMPLMGDLRNQGLDNFNMSTLGTISWVDGKLGTKALQAGNANQTSNGISINSNLTDILAEEYSISVWVKPLGNHVHYNGTILSSGDWNHTRWAFGVNQDNTKVDVLSNRHNVYLNCTVPVNEWTHLVCTCDSSNKVHLYKNGEYIGYTTLSEKPSSDANNTTIGRETYASGYFSFNGVIQDLRLYDHCLSQMEVKQLSQGLILHYPLNRQGWGQDNLIINSNDFTKWTKESVGKVTLESDGFYHITSTTTNGTRYGIYYDFTFPDVGTYTLSALVKTEWHIGFSAASSFVWTSQTIGGTGDEQIVSKTVTTTSENNKCRIYLWGTNDTSGNVVTSNYIKWMKIEKGSIATPWCPNPTDALYSTLGLNSIIEYDCSGFCNNGTKTGTFGWTSDTPKYAVSQYFNGSSYILTDSGTFSWFSFDKCTIAAWFKPTTTPGNYTGTIGISHDRDAGHKSFCIGNYGGKFTVCTADGSNYVNTQSVVLPINEWHHCAATLDGTTVKMYVDGELVKTYTLSWGNAGLATDMRFQAGIDLPGSDEKYTGYYSDARVYATALSPSDVKSLYQNCATIDPDGTIRGQIRS